MNRRPLRIRTLGWLISAFAVVICMSCGTGSPPDPARYLPGPQDARRAIEESLEAWRKSPRLERTTSTIRPVMFADQSRRPGQRLREFTILRESAGVEGCRRFEVKLALEEPDESILASYYVFGQGPIWVYRAEDFEMMMHMEPMIKAVDASEANDRPKAESEHHNHAPPRDASEGKTGSRLPP